MDEPRNRDKVLIVDDIPENLDILMEALSGKYAVVAARDGEKALRLVTGPTPPDIILLDVMMPGMDGYEVCARLQSNQATRDIPVIFLTALSDEESELRGLAAGAVDYIHKPISMPLVQARVAAHLNLVRAKRQLAAQVQELSDAAKLRDDVDRIMRHDLKTPLNPVIGFSCLMRDDGNITDKQRYWLDLIHSSGLMMLEMINRSLDLFKMESGTYDYRPTTLQLAAVVHRVVGDLAPLAAGKGNVVEVLGEKIAACGEEMLCYSMLSNLVKNAIEAAPTSGRVTIALALEGDRGVISIQNPGVVPEQMRHTFFDKYTTSGKQGGSGIGTYSARLMAETMKGEIKMESSDAIGTRITVRLPVAELVPGTDGGKEE
ncbi:MAG: hybrid sensor histidine kinase/response regulator [Desulfobulbaceae bacterium]|nr:hybrid sensor histidine kinase/response regulator [Desulfobulbaceae bacterium]HIJ90450.1 hybrid sensor histidine kinase/response regulator [Deltaproteobacteria bacterium]